jgi:hypothetical protein
VNAFEQYAKQAKTIVSRPTPLVGVIKTRGAARVRYSEIVAELHACDDEDMLNAFLASINAETAQFRAELPFLWDGEDDFPGLHNEIEMARERARMPLC